MKFRNLASALTLAVVGLLGASAQAAQIFTPGDPIVAIWNTTASGNSTASTAGTASAGQYPAGEAAPLAIDGLSTTKYLNFGGGGGAGVSTGSKGLGTGFYITPTVTDSIVQSFQFTAANDAPDRDPLSITIEGSNGGALDQGASWTLIYAGTTGLATDPGRFNPGTLVPVTGNVTTYDSYRVLVTSQRGVANSVQFAEVQFYGVPEPTSIVLAGIAGVALLGFARRRTA